MRPKIKTKYPFYISCEKGRIRLFPQEASLLFVLMFHKEASDELILEVLWPDPDLMPDTWANVIRVTLNNLRAKLQPHGWEIINRFGYGYSLEMKSA